MPSHKIPQIPRALRWIALLLLVAVLAAACSSSGEQSSETSDGGLSLEPADDAATNDAVEPPSTNGDPAPEVVFTYFDGTEGTLDDFAGQPVVLNFWASWCAPCVAEMPDLEDVFQEVSGDVAFLGVNVTDQRADAEELVERTGVTYTIAEDPDGEIHRAFRGFAMPTTILIAADGTVVRSHAGSVSADQLRGFITEDLGV